MIRATVQLISMIHVRGLAGKRGGSWKSARALWRREVEGMVLIHIDNTYLFTVIDRTTMWPEAIPLSSTTASDRTEAVCQIALRLSPTTVFLTSSRSTGAHNLLRHCRAPTATCSKSTTPPQLRESLCARCASTAWTLPQPTWDAPQYSLHYPRRFQLHPAEALYGSLGMRTVWS